MDKKYASSSIIGRYPPHKEFLRERLFRLLGRSREHTFVWGCGPEGFGIIAFFSSRIENKGFQCPWYQSVGSYRCIKTFIYNNGIAAAKPLRRKRKLFPPPSTEYQLDHQSFAQHFFQDFYGRLKVQFTLSFDILQKVLLVEIYMRGGK